ncbi:MAG: histidine kinase [Myxococcota bacterium]
MRHRGRPIPESPQAKPTSSRGIPVIVGLGLAWVAVPCVQFFAEIYVLAWDRGWPEYAWPSLIMMFGLAGLAAAFLCWLLARLPERWLMDLRALPVVFILSLLATVPCTLLLAVLLNEVYALGPTERLGPPRVLYVALELAPLLMIWSGFAFLAVVGRRRNEERMRLLEAEAREREARLRLVQAESLARDAQLRHLRARIHPHFLFNTLSAAVALVRPAPDRAEIMLIEMSALLRRAIDGVDQSTVTLGEEIDFIARYLRCMEIRFVGKLGFSIDVPADLRQLPIPFLLLQPLVENAVKHGLRGRARIEVGIAARHRAHGELEIEVANDGHLGTASALPADGTHGTGLDVVRKRLAARYPDTARFDLDQRDGIVLARVVFDPFEAETSPATLARAWSRSRLDGPF